MNSDFGRLIDWYLSQCNGDWEHQHGFTVSSLDNPALRLKVDLNGTYLENVDFDSLEKNIETESEWLFCKKSTNNVFDGCCAPKLFGNLIDVFLDWADLNKEET